MGVQFLPVNSVAANGASNGNAVLLQRDLLDGECNRGIIEADRHIDFVGVEPLTRNRRADIGFALVIANDNIDRFPEHLAAGVLDSHTRSNDRAGAAKIGIHA